LRKLIVELENSKKELPELYVFAHSLGATTATTLVINTSAKLQTEYREKIKHNKENNHPIDKGIKDLLEKNENVNYKLIQKFKTDTLPKSKIRIFLSAPAIGGKNTFIDMEEEIKKRTSFFTTINTCDKMLNKFIGIINKLGVTSLGVNNKEDVYVTCAKYFYPNGYFFYNENFMEHRPHNIFEYMEYPEYKNLIKEYWTFEFPKK